MSKRPDPSLDPPDDCTSSAFDSTVPAGNNHGYDNLNDNEDSVDDDDDDDKVALLEGITNSTQSMSLSSKQTNGTHNNMNGHNGKQRYCCRRRHVVASFVVTLLGVVGAYYDYFDVGTRFVDISIGKKKKNNDIGSNIPPSVIDISNQVNRSNWCQGENPTDLKKTVQRLNTNARVVDWDYLNDYFVWISVSFQAQDFTGSEKETGGDEFVWTISGLTTQSLNSTIAWKTTVVAQDFRNGTYMANFSMPIADAEHTTIHDLSLMLYYTCDQGFPLTPSTTKGFYDVASADPESIDSAFLVDWMKMNLKIFTNGTTFSTDMIDLPECSLDQHGMDGLSSGIWMEDNSAILIDERSRCSLQPAIKWVPTTCQPPDVQDIRNGRFQTTAENKTDINYKVFRVGDSTMPPVGGQVGGYKWNIGDPFSSTYRHLGFHDLYLEILTRYVLPNITSANDVMVVSHGLHQILQGYNIETGVNLVLRMVCQLSLIFPGKIVFQGPVPIQQQLFQRIDIADMNVNLMKAMIRQRIVTADYKLANLCQEIPVEQFLSAHNEDGELLSQEETVNIFEERRNYSPEKNATDDETKLIQHFVELTQPERSALWGEREIYFVDVASMLRPRPECYRDGDKIHAMRQTNRGNLIGTGHEDLLRSFTALRAKMGP